MHSISIGLSESARTEITQKLQQLLASNYTLYLKTHQFHWNVTGPMFQTLHALFEVQYKDLWQFNDLVAERIRALGFFVTVNYTEFTQLSVIQEVNLSRAKPTSPDMTAEQMVSNLQTDHEQMTSFIREIIILAEKVGDYATIDLVTARMAFHEKQGWWLRSFLTG